MTATSCLEIDLSRLEANYHAITQTLDSASSICAVVKANGYGLGAVAVARRLANAGAAMLAVYDTKQAAELVNAGINTTYLVLMPVFELSRTDALYRTAVGGNLHLTVHTKQQVDAVEQIGQTFGTPMPIHIEVDTGMSRCGMSITDAEQVLRLLGGRRYLRLAGLFTHAASADDDLFYTTRQADAFDALLERTADCLPPDTIIHFANSHAMLRSQQHHRNMVRLGLSLCGYGLDDLTPGPALDPLPGVEPVLKWTSQIVHIIDVPSGTPVGYGGTFTTWRDSRLAIVPVGYADGYPLSLSNKSVVRVGDGLAVAEVRGKVNMDQLIVDVTPTPQMPVDIAIGTPVEIYSDDPVAPNALPTLAAKAQSSTYELLCRLSGRLIRRYITTDQTTGATHHIGTTR